MRDVYSVDSGILSRYSELHYLKFAQGETCCDQYWGVVETGRTVKTLGKPKVKVSRGLHCRSYRERMKQVDVGSKIWDRIKMSLIYSTHLIFNLILRTIQGAMSIYINKKHHI